MNGGFTRLGRAISNPIILFCWVILGLLMASAVGAALHWQVFEPSTGRLVGVDSLLSAGNAQRLLTSAPATATSFMPLGIILIVALGGAVAERSGLFDGLVRASLKRAPDQLLTPIVVLVGLVAHQLSDALMVIYFPLAGVAYAAKGRSPVLGIATAFAAFSGGFAANFTPGEQDLVLLNITQAAARLVDPNWPFNPLANWYFTAVVALVYLLATWVLTDKVLEPHFQQIGLCEAAQLAAAADTRLTPAERTGLGRAALVALLVIAGFAALMIFPAYQPLIDTAATGPARFEPAFRAMPIALMALLLATGWVYGAATGGLRTGEEVVAAMGQGVVKLAPYVLTAVFIAHVVVMVRWSNLGEVLMLTGAQGLRHAALPAPVLIALLVGVTALLDLLIGSASAKWAILAPIVVPMLMTLGVSPAMSTAAYRIGDGATNVITPLMPCVTLVVIYCQSWYKSFSFGSLLATMAPYAATYLTLGTVIVVAWASIGAPLGPYASAKYVQAPVAAHR